MIPWRDGSAYHHGNDDKFLLLPLASTIMMKPITGMIFKSEEYVSTLTGLQSPSLGQICNSPVIYYARFRWTSTGLAPKLEALTLQGLNEIIATGGTTFFSMVSHSSQEEDVNEDDDNDNGGQKCNKYDKGDSDSRKFK